MAEAQNLCFWWRGWLPFQRSAEAQSIPITIREFLRQPTVWQQLVSISQTSTVDAARPIAEAALHRCRKVAASIAQRLEATLR